MTLVFLHPVGLDGDCWQFLDTSGLGTVVPFTLLWHGDRPQPEGELTMEAFADDVAGNTDGLLDIVGLSLGGSVAQHVALRHPGRVRSILVAASAAGGPARPAHLERAATVEARGMAGVVDSTLERWFTPETLARPGAPGVAYARHRLETDRPASFAATWRALSKHDTTERLRELTMPVTVLHPTEDSAGGIEPKAAMVERLPLGRLVVVAGPHMVQLENPAGFRAAIDEHLDWVKSVQRPGRVQGKGAS